MKVQEKKLKKMKEYLHQLLEDAKEYKCIKKKAQPIKVEPVTVGNGTMVAIQ